MASGRSWGWKKMDLSSEPCSATYPLVETPSTSFLSFQKLGFSHLLSETAPSSGQRRKSEIEVWAGPRSL